MDRVTDLFAQNLSSLTRYHRNLAEKLLGTSSDPDFCVTSSNTGSPVPVFRGNTSPLYLNSKYDPAREAKRFVESSRSARSYLLLGIDAGFTLRELLRREETELIVIVDYDLRYLRFLFEHFDFVSPLLDPRVALLINPVKPLETLLNTYIPLFHGDLAVLSVRARERMNEGFFSKIRALIPKLQEYSAIDISTQKKFALRWMRNTTKNYIAAAKAATESYMRLPFALPDGSEERHGPKVHVTAAGPSLEVALSTLQERAAGEYIVATDTSVPFLVSSGITPDFIVSVDCQNHSYHHFFSVMPGSVLVLDLASPPGLFRLGNPVVPVAGGHPFSTYLSRYIYPFISIDTSGGNVTHAAVSFAERFRSREIEIHGADFSYPEGKLYAKGTYLYKYFATFEDRVRNLETMTARMLFEKSGLTRERMNNGGICYLSPLLESYRERLSDAASTLSTDLLSDGGVLARGSERPQEHAAGMPDTPALPDWKAIRRNLLDDLAGITIGSGSFQSILSRLDNRKLDLLYAVMPLAARHLLPDSRRKGSELLKLAVSDARKIINHAGVQDA